ncbi:MAG: hypothetical protein RLZZ437_2317 [Pseudomonadota bacterium]|jgi:sec-independent protein translocase protein TatB
MDIGWTELILIGVVALIVIGPKDLPEMFRTLGRFTAKLRSMSRDFSRAMEQAAKETGVKDVAKDIRNVASPSSLGLNAVKDAATKFEQWDPLKSSKPVAAAKPAMAVTVPAGNQAVATPAVAAPVVAEPVVAEPVVAAPKAPAKPRAPKAAAVAKDAAAAPVKKPRAPRKKAEG